MNNILITGGAGFIGSQLSIKLTAIGFTVTVLDNLSPQIHGSNPESQSYTYKKILEAGVRCIKGTVTEKQDWINALEGQDAVIHLAAETGTGQSMYEINKYINVNIHGTGLLLDSLANSKHSIKKMVIASSRAIYGEGKYKCSVHGFVYPEARTDKDMAQKLFECRCPFCDEFVALTATDERSAIHPTSVYGITKQNQEQMILTVGKSLGIPSVALRYQNVYGPGQSLANPYTGILSIFSTQIKNNNNINIFEDGKESRDFVYIDDVVNATILALTKDEANYEVFNVGSGETTDVSAIAALLKQNYSSDIDIIISGNYRLGDIRHNYANLSKIEKTLGYKPEVSFKKGLENFCSWVNSQEVKEDKYQASIDEMKLKGLYK